MIKRYNYGYGLGALVHGVSYINNHLIFKLRYNTLDNVSSEVLPSQWKLMTKDTKKVHFTYEVRWEKSEVRWASRWDAYSFSQSGRVHWFSLLNSTVVVILLTAIISMILIRTLRRDIAKYNRADAEDIIEESGWKLVHGDVFRPPRFPRLLSALFGSGVQVFCMVFIVIFFAMLGMLSPVSRGAVMSAALFTYVMMGLFAGYFSGRLYKTFRGQLWKSTALLTGVLFPKLILVIWSVLNSMIWYRGSSAAVPFTTALSILSLWLCVSLPLVFIGFYFGFRKRAYELPTRTNQIPRAVPTQKAYNNTLVAMLCHGALPFGALFIEVFFIYMAIWESHFYYLFGFLFSVFVLFVICCAQVSIMMTYFQLCQEDYRWWWRTFIASGGCAIYLFIYSAFYYSTKLNITQFVPTVIYFGYTTLICIAMWILSGTVGLAATFFFLRVIYSAIKVD